jgi:hypothetical protein
MFSEISAGIALRDERLSEENTEELQIEFDK